MAEYIEPISSNTLEIIGDSAFRAITPLLKVKGYNFVGGVSGGKEYSMCFKRDAMDILGWEKPIILKIVLPYAPEEYEYKTQRITYSSIPERESNLAIYDYKDYGGA